MSTTTTATATATKSGGRIEVVDWLRGAAVVFMILAHGMDAWLLPAAKTGTAYALIRVGAASRRGCFFSSSAFRPRSSSRPGS